MDKKERIEQLKAKIATLETALEAIEKHSEHIRPLSSFSDAEKVAVFDELHKTASEYLEELIKDGFGWKDAEHWFYEAVLTKCLGFEVWTVINTIKG